MNIKREQHVHKNLEYLLSRGRMTATAEKDGSLSIVYSPTDVLDERTTISFNKKEVELLRKVVLSGHTGVI